MTEPPGITPAHPKHKHNAEAEVLRAIASFELTKGLVVLLAGFGALSLVHRDVWDVAISLLRLLHIKHRYHYADIFLRLAEGVTDRELVLVAVVAALYSSLRFIEAFGLWKQRAWAEWVALISGGVYLPFEIVELFRHATLIKLAIFLANLGIVFYMLYLRLLKKDSSTRGAVPTR
jgi:uncharacterized membrane protein (DUF2068 family)